MYWLSLLSSPKERMLAVPEKARQDELRVNKNASHSEQPEIWKSKYGITRREFTGLMKEGRSIVSRCLRHHKGEPTQSLLS